MTTPEETAIFEGSRLPNPASRPLGELEQLERVWRLPRGWCAPAAVNNTVIGQLYIGTAFLFLILAGILGLLMRAQLAVPGNTLLSADTYNQVFTMHGTVMMFLFAVPVVEAVAVYLLPNMLGARDLPFPRLSAYAYWAYAFGGLAFFCTLFVGLAPDGGWFMYPPLTSRQWSPGLNADFWLLGIGFIEISAIAGAIELIIGILMTRAPGMTLARMPVYAWAMLVVGVMIVFAFPAIIAGTTLLEMERAFDWPFFIAERGGDPLLWQHLFWFFGHPEVYIIFLPAAGMVSAMVPALTGTRLVARHAIVAALLGTAFFSFALWSHHMFTAGLGSLSMGLVSAASLAVAVPTSIQVFAWIATLWQGRVRLNTPTLFLLGFLFTFVLGGLTGVMVAILPFDWQAHDTYFIVAHLHYVLIGGVLFPVFAALYYWFPLVNGHQLSEAWGRWIAGLVVGGFQLTFFPMHVAGLMGMPRRVYTYEAGLGWEWPNLLSSGGSAVLGIGIALLTIDMVRTWRKPQQPHRNPWNAPSLEWLPAGNYNTRSIPQVHSPDPLWEQAALPQEVQEGRHWLPGTATGLRETLITSARAARPTHLLVLPRDSWLPVVAAFGTAAFFMLLTIKWVITAFAFGLLAVACVVVWLWQSDRLPKAATVQVAEGVMLRVGHVGPRSHSYWATVILLLVDMTVLASMAFAHIHVSMLGNVCPPAGARTPAWQALLLPCGLFMLSALMVLTAGAGRAAHGLSRWRAGWMPAASVIAAMAFHGSWQAYTAAGLAPTARAWDATIAAMLGYVGFHMAVLLVCGLYVGARIWAGLSTPRQRATVDNVTLLWMGSVLQGIAVSLLPLLVAKAMS